MGKIDVVLSGSFRPNDGHQFSAMAHGHAAAAMEAITWLTQTCLPRALRQDKALKERGQFPSDGFRDYDPDWDNSANAHSLLWQIQDAITFDSKEEAATSPYGLPPEVAFALRQFLSIEENETDVTK